MALSLIMIGGPLDGQYHNGDVRDTTRVAHPAPAVNSRPPSADGSYPIEATTYRRRDIILATGDPYPVLVATDLTLRDALCMLEARYASSTRQLQQLQAELDELRAYREQIEGMTELCLNKPKRRATKNTPKGLLK